MKQLGTFYEAPPAVLIDKDDRTVGFCLDTPNAIAYCMAKDRRISKVLNDLGFKTRKDYKDRFWFARNDFNDKTALWTRLQ